MVQTPTKVLAIVSIVFAFQFLFLTSVGTQTEKGFQENVTDPNNSSTFGFSEDLGTFGVLSAIFGVIQIFIDLLTFNIPGAPGWIRFIVSIILDGSLAWSIAALIRGA